MAYALITGATGGIGRELAALLAHDGHDLILTARGIDRLEAMRDRLERAYGVRVVPIAADLSEEGAARGLFEETRRRGLDVDVLVNNAGFAQWTRFLDADWERQRAMMRVNMDAVAELAHAYGRAMAGRGRGRILNVSSVASMMAGPYMAMYFASKAFVRSLGEALSFELRGSGVTVTTVCPGPTSTGFERAAAMHGRNFFTMTRPASAAGVARFAYARMMRGRALGYHAAFTWAGALAERTLPRAVTRRIAAFMNGGDPGRAGRRTGRTGD